MGVHAGFLTERERERIHLEARAERSRTHRQRQKHLADLRRRPIPDQAFDLQRLRAEARRAAEEEAARVAALRGHAPPSPWA